MLVDLTAEEILELVQAGCFYREAMFDWNFEPEDFDRKTAVVVKALVKLQQVSVDYRPPKPSVPRKFKPPPEGTYP